MAKVQPPYRLKIPARLASSTTTTTTTEQTALKAAPAYGPSYELYVAEFVDEKYLGEPFPHHYDLRVSREDRSAAQLIRSMRMMHKGGWCIFGVGHRKQTAVLLPGASSFDVGIGFRLHDREPFAECVSLVIDSETRGVEPLLLTAHMASQTTEPGRSPRIFAGRLVEAEADHQIERAMLGDEPTPARRLLCGR